MKGQIRKNIRERILDNLCLQCIDILIRAYKMVLIDNNFKTNWEEDTFTAHLLVYLDRLKIEEQWCINPQVVLYSKKISQGLISPLKATKPDIKFEKYVFQNQKPFTYYIEAKNLSEVDWNKENGSKVVASSQIRRYVNTGIENFKTERYPNGCLAGYVVQGRIIKIVEKINNRLCKLHRDRESLSQIVIEDNTMGQFISYHITNSRNELSLKHILLRFYN